MTSNSSAKQTPWNGKWIAETLKTEGSSHEFTSIVTDSRKIQPGCLFVALKGDNFDGHDFIPAAIQQGATGIVLRKDFTSPRQPGVSYFPVTDTLSAYRELGKAWRSRFTIPIAMIAGSNGKTTTKELLYALLQGKWPTVLKTQGSQNGFVGIPMTLLELNSSHGAAVIEVGIDEPGAMESHVDVVAPTVSVLTIVQPEHLEKLIDLKTVAHEEGIALTGTAKRGGMIAVNCDDPLIAPHLSDIHTKNKLGYTLEARANDASILAGRVTDDGAALEIVGGKFKVPEVFTLPLRGRHNATNLLAAIAVASLLGLTAEEMKKGLARFQAPEGRSQIKTLRDQTTVICDFYNSQPASLKAGLELLGELSRQAAKPARFACLADMLELGTEEERYHREPASQIMSQGVDHVYLYGKRMRWLEDELKKKQFKGVLKTFDSHAQMAEELSKTAEAGSIILIKGSNSMKMGEVWKAFEARRSS